MATTILNVKVDPRVKSRAKQVASRLGLNLSVVINGYLRELIRTETFTVSTRPEEPSEFLLAALRESEEDLRKGRTIGFDDPEEALKFLDTLKSKKRRYAH
ncbi:MAG: hypothetical protein Q7K39_00425 [Candidatus Magasanikbacteria bacterium]|nr:hypothetical protein [Candidatus Magasanikbacteria bacterium]